MGILPGWISSTYPLLVLMEEWTILGVLQVLLTLIFVLGSYYVMFHPFNRIKDLCDIGYDKKNRQDPHNNKTKQQMANDVRRLKKRGDLPPVFPNGWFAICESDELKVGKSMPIYALGENLVVFRTEEGKACVLDAYCPHLGAHLGVGGRVVGNCIECPFHGWQFDGRDGHCAVIPYAAGKVPQVAKVKSWPCDEVNGVVFVWYHAEQEPPSWKVPAIPEIESKAWAYRGRSDYKVNCHIQEIPENGADVAHLAHLHGPSLHLGSSLQTMSRIDRIASSLLLRHQWHAEWSNKDDKQPHVGISNIKQDYLLFGRFPIIKTTVRAEQIGPGLTHLFIDTAVGKCVFIFAVTPIEPLVQRILHRLYASPSMVTPFAKLLFWGESIMLERDVAVWNQKTYIGRPVLVPEDQTIQKHRRWFKQFYSENSPRLEPTSKGMNDKSISDW